MNSSVICELLLCAASLWAAVDSLKTGHGWRALGFTLIAVTALLGALVYGGLETTRPAHQAMTSLSGRITLLLIAIAWPGRSQRWPLAMAGALLFVLAGLGIAGRGEWQGIPRVDLYHLTLMLATLCWTLARLRGTRWLPGTPASLAR
ncbi:MAG: hypothetical protein QM805_18695 [Pseudomonas sp.]